jgi:hypothetical protein
MSFSQSIPYKDAGLYIIGNSGTVATAPVVHSQKPVQQISGGKVYFATGSHYDIPLYFAGKTMRIAAYTMSGKLVKSFITRDRSVQLYKGGTFGDGIGIVKITEIH